MAQAAAVSPLTAVTFWGEVLSLLVIEPSRTVDVSK